MWEHKVYLKIRINPLSRSTNGNCLFRRSSLSRRWRTLSVGPRRGNMNHTLRFLQLTEACSREIITPPRDLWLFLVRYSESVLRCVSLSMLQSGEGSLLLAGISPQQLPPAGLFTAPRRLRLTDRKQCDKTKKHLTGENPLGSDISDEWCWRRSSVVSQTETRQETKCNMWPLKSSPENLHETKPTKQHLPMCSASESRLKTKWTQRQHAARVCSVDSQGKTAIMFHNSCPRLVLCSVFRWFSESASSYFLTRRGQTHYRAETTSRPSKVMAKIINIHFMKEATASHEKYLESIFSLNVMKNQGTCTSLGYFPVFLFFFLLIDHSTAGLIR